MYVCVCVCTCVCMCIVCMHICVYTVPLMFKFIISRGLLTSVCEHVQVAREWLTVRMYVRFDSMTNLHSGSYVRFWRIAGLM